MKKIILLLLLFVKPTYSQELVNSIDINVEEIKSFNCFNNDKKNEYILILKHKETIEFIKTDQKFNIIDRFNYSSNEKYGEFLGNSFNENMIYTYWIKNKKLVVLSVDFINKKAEKNEIVYPTEFKDKILCNYSKDNFFHTITVSKESSIINLYTFKGLKVEKKSIDCSYMTFFSSYGEKINLWDFLIDGNDTVYKASFPIFYIDKMNLNSVHATEKKKIYIDDESVIISSDVNNNYSQFVIISLSNFTVSNPLIISHDKNSKHSLMPTESNSFVIGDYVFIAKFSTKLITIIVKDFNNVTLNSFSITATEGHEYINSELIEESGGIKNREILKNVEKFLRKSSAKNPSIIGFISEGNYHLSISGVSYPRQQSSQMLGMFGLIGGITASIINDGSGPSISSYSDKVVVNMRSYISATDFKPTNLKNVTSNFDNVRFYVENNNSKENILTLFESNNHFYLFTFKHKQEKVKIYKF